MPTQDEKEEKMLPKEPLDLPLQSNQSSANSPHEVKTLLAWTAPGRPFQKRRKEYYLTSLLILLFVEIILFSGLLTSLKSE